MKLLEQKIRRIKVINDQLEELHKMADRLQYYAQNPDKEMHQSGQITVYDTDGNKPVKMDTAHLLHYPGGIREFIQLRIETLQKEFDELEEVFAVTERLLKS